MKQFYNKDIKSNRIPRFHLYLSQALELLSLALIPLEPYSMPKILLPRMYDPMGQTHKKPDLHSFEILIHIVQVVQGVLICEADLQNRAQIFGHFARRDHSL